MTIINIFVIICLFGGLVALFRELERAYKNYKFRKEYQIKEQVKARIEEIMES